MNTIKTSNDLLELVSIDEAMEHSRITDEYDIELSQSYLDSAHGLVEQWLNRKLIPTTMQGYVECFKSHMILPYPPIQSVTSVVAENSSGESVTIPPEQYKFNSILGSIKFRSDYSAYQDFIIEFVCGYPIDTCPIPIKHAIKMTFATLYELREDAITGTQINEVPITARNIVKSYRVGSSR